MKLTDPKVRNAKAKEKPYKLSDGRGMYLQVNKNGSKYWRMNYRYAGKQKTLALGVYPEVSLKEARSSCEGVRKLIADDKDPSELRKTKKKEKIKVAEAAAAKVKNTFEAVAREWLAMESSDRTEKYRAAILRRLENHIFPCIGGDDVSDISKTKLLSVLDRIQAKGTIYLGQRVKMNCSQVFNYAIDRDKATANPASAISAKTIKSVDVRHHPSITDPVELGGLLRAINSYSGHFVTQCALKLAPLVFLRPSELGKSEWVNIDLDKKEWVLRPEQMKQKKSKRQKHVVPLSAQAVAILKELQPLTGRGKYLFPSIRTASRPMSENTINAALRRLGYTKDEMTGHGFRSTASTLLNEQGWNRDAIERQLDHVEGNSVRAAYNYAEHMPERVRMMTHWANYLDGLASGADVISINRNQS